MRETLPEVSVWALGVILLNPVAYPIFKECLAKSGEFLPISINEDIYYLFNVTYIIPESETDKETAIEVIDSGVHLGQSNVSFNEDFLEGEKLTVFKTVTDRLAFSYCTDEFKILYDDNNFKGLTSEPLGVN
jgi:hypothetical protein